MVLGTVPGIEIGARIIEGLEATGSIDTVVGVTYVIILLAIGTFTAWESLRAMQLVSAEQMEAEEALALWSSHDLGADAAIVGRLEEGRAQVILETELGGERLLDELEDDPLPRIC
mgnify:CR=1 FL=1